MTQYGFFIDLSRCTGCNACVIACKQWHDIRPGPVKWLRVYQWEKGTFPDIDLRVLPVMCFHCENPACTQACPNGAIYKEEKYGAVLIDPAKCTGERKCWKACPYGTPQFAGEGPGLEMSKCNMCIDRLEQGLAPICVLSCSLRALEFGPMDALQEKYGHLRQLEQMPRESITVPSVIFKQADPKKQIVPWDWRRTLELWKKRHADSGEPLPEVFTNAADILEVPDETYGRNKLVLKPENSVRLMFYTTDDE